MTTTPRSVPWSPISGSLDQVLKCEELQSAHCPRAKCAGLSKDQQQLGHLKLCALSTASILNLLRGNGLLQDHRAASAIHLWYCLPGS